VNLCSEHSPTSQAVCVLTGGALIAELLARMSRQTRMQVMRFVPLQLSELTDTCFISEQGTGMGRRSLLHVRIRVDEGNIGIDVGGHVTPGAAASIHLAI
jgi:predicted PhzF superfamily epimerase YddE/YHI9